MKCLYQSFATVYVFDTYDMSTNKNNSNNSIIKQNIENLSFATAFRKRSQLELLNNSQNHENKFKNEEKEKISVNPSNKLSISISSSDGYKLACSLNQNNNLTPHSSSSQSHPSPSHNSSGSPSNIRTDRSDRSDQNNANFTITAISSNNDLVNTNDNPEIPMILFPVDDEEIERIERSATPAIDMFQSEVQNDDVNGETQKVSKVLSQRRSLSIIAPSETVAAESTSTAKDDKFDENTLKASHFELKASGFKRTPDLQQRLFEYTQAQSHGLPANSRSLSFSTASLVPEALFESAKESDIIELSEIGRGAGGRVIRALHKPTMTIIALKCIDNTDKSKRKQLLKELNELSSEFSPHIVSFYNAYYSSKTVKLMLEYMNRGSLQDIINTYGALSEPVVSSICKQALLGLKYLHQQSKVHRDIKPGNLLVSSSGRVKLADFGLLAQLENSNDKCQTFIGTKVYMGPERLAGLPYSFSADIW